MAKTKLEDVIVPEIFANYVLQKTTDRNALITSGIASADENVAQRMFKGGKGIELPFWKRTNARSEVLSESSPMTTHKIVAGGDYAAVHARGIGYSSNDLSGLFAGDDPMNAMATMVADDWSGSFQEVLLASLKGVFGATSMSDHVLDISTKTGDDGVLSNNALIDAIYLLGDNFKNLTGLAMHSAVMAKLAKLKLLDDYPRDASQMAPEFDTYMRRRIIVDDAISPETITVGSDTSAKAYPIYLFGNGAVAYNESPALMETEPDRDSGQGDDYLYTRRVFTMHPRGIKWIGSPAGATASNEELATGTNWELVEDSKNVLIAKLIVRLD